jgi:PKD repeat protein/subtilisin family serine protease
MMKNRLCILLVLLLVILPFLGHALNHATKQTGARNRVWSQGITGDPNMSVAVFDTGIDPNHIGFSVGYTQDGDWNSKIVYWYAGEESNSPVPVDDTELGAGHGTHAAGIVAANGFGNAEPYYDNLLGQDVYRMVNTNAYTSGLNIQYSEQTALHVDAVGLIEIKYAFDSDRGNCDALYLKFGNVEQAYEVVGDNRIMVGDNTTVASIDNPVGTPNLRSGSTFPYEIQWNTLTYRVNDPSQFGTYHIVTQRSGIASGGSIPVLMAFEYVAKYPVDMTVSNNTAIDPDDGLPYYMGMAPDVKLFGVQAGGATAFIDSVNSLWNEFDQYHVGVLSLSAASSSFSSQAGMFDSLENMGIIVCAAGGNEGPASSLGYPAKFDNVVAVEGVGPAETIPWYPNTGYEIDILAPGGSNLTGGGIISVHNTMGNFGPTSAGWGTDVVANDGLGMQGSSMATPSAAGVFALVLDALGGWDNYLDNNDFTLNGNVLSKQEKARHAKRLVFMTATELNTKREINKTTQDPSGRDPILNRGYDSSQDPAAQYYGKDVHEGYGRVNADAAVDAVLHDLPFNSAEAFSLVSSRAVWSSTILNEYHIYDGIYDLAKARASKAFARHIDVTQADLDNGIYNGPYPELQLSVPAGGDFDLYLYKPQWGPTGQPLLMARSVNPQEGAAETIDFNPTEPGRYYIVVKAISGEGDAMLTFGSAGVSANFIYSAEGLTVSFTDTSVAQNSTVIAWQWDLGDGTVSTDRNPVHSYAAPGVYTVSLLASDNEGNSSVKVQDIDLRYDLTPTSASLDYTGVTVVVENFGEVEAVAPVDVTVYQETSGGGSATLIDNQLETQNPFTFSSDGMWEWGVVTSGPGSAYSGTKAIATNLDGRYNNNMDTWAQLSVDVSGNGTKTLEFYHYYDLDGGYSSDTGEDTGIIEVSEDGANWTIIAPEGGYPGTARDNPVLADGTPCYTQKLSGWQKVTVDLSAYNSILNIRFRVISNESWSYRGWYIDDIKITSESAVSWTKVFEQTANVTVSANNSATVSMPYAFSDGYYRIDAVVNGSNDSDNSNNSISQEMLLGTLPPAQPTAAFTYSNAGLTVTFTDASSSPNGSVTAWSWDFGDSSSATSQSPVHTYNAAGSYIVTLTITDNAGESDIYSETVTVSENNTSSYTNDTPYDIPDGNSAGVLSPIVVDRTGDAGNLEVSVNITHPYSGDISITLIAPDGTEWLLRYKEGYGTDDIIETYQVDATGTESYGIWNLKVVDHYGIYAGTLNSWSLNFN